jgi:hypothetical protein
MAFRDKHPTGPDCKELMNCHFVSGFKARARRGISSPTGRHIAALEGRAHHTSDRTTGSLQTIRATVSISTRPGRTGYI